MTTIIARSAESVHWYRQDGGPQYTVLAKDGSQRPTTLRDARLRNLVPSVTTVLKVVAKPALEAWKLEQMLLSALTLPRIEGESSKDLVSRIVRDSKETGKQAAEAGTRIHESIEKWHKGQTKVEHPEIATSFVREVCNHFKTPVGHHWNAENSFASPLGFGGKIDLFTGVSESIPTGIVLDAKSKEFAPEDKVVAYIDNLMQLAAYRYGLNLPEARCANVFASRTHPGLIKIVEWEEEDLQRGWAMFQLLLQFWKLNNKFEWKAP